MSLKAFIAMTVLFAGGCARAPASSSTEPPLRAAALAPESDGRNRNTVPGTIIPRAEVRPAQEHGGLIELPLKSGWAYWNALRGDEYALDEIERFIDGLERPRRLACDQEGLVEYRGSTVRYHGPVRVAEPFRERLERFEALVADTATEVYGRAPRRIRHYGAFSCRTSRNRSYRLSEHALGNAIDVVGFDFGAASKEQPLPEGLPKRLKHPFEVRVVRHWTAPDPTPHNQSAVLHSRFLRELTTRLQERRDIFRGLIGPGHRGHADHFHFDMSPWRYVRL